MTRTLIVMRHAKSSWGTSEPDHQRPLNKRGRQDALAAGAILADYPLDAVLSSSATRTRQTWQRAVEGGAQCPDVEFTDALYGAWTDAVIELVSELEDSVTTALVLGHEPTVSSVVQRLAEASDLSDEAGGQFPTCAIAFLEFDGSWGDLAAEGARMGRFEIPRD